MIQTQAFNIVLPIPLVRKIDEAAANEMKNRSELIREAVRVYLAEKEEWNNLYDYGQTQAKKLNIKNNEQVSKIIKSYRQGK